MYYKEELDSCISAYKQNWLGQLNRLDNIQTIPSDLVSLIRYERSVADTVSQVSSLQIPPVSFDLVAKINAEFDAKDKNQELKRQQLKDEEELAKQAAVKQHEKEVADVHEYNLNLIKPLKDKHEELLMYKTELETVFKRYDITPLDMDISDSVTLKEFSTLIDECIATCTKYISKQRDITGKILEPLRTSDSVGFSLSMVGIGVLACYVLSPILSVPAFGYMFYSVHGMYKDIEKLRIACALMSQIDYNRFVPESDFKQVSELDTESITQEFDERIKSINDYSAERSAALKEASQEVTSINKACSTAFNELCAARSDLLQKLNAHLEEVRSALTKAREEYVAFPHKQNNRVVMSHEYVLGKVEGELDVTANLPLKNIVFDSSDRAAAIDNMKLYLANALLSVRVKQLTVEIFDPKNMCEDFTEFFTEETRQYIKPNGLTLDKLIETYRKYSQDNVIALDKKTIDEFNLDAEERELVPKEYKLLLIISEFDKLNKDEQQRVFGEYFKFSAATGVMVWLLDNKQWPGSVWVPNTYNLQGNKLAYSRQLGKDAVATFTKSLAEFKDTGIDYVEKYGNVFLPKEKWWTFNTIDNIYMPIGLENGDPTRGLPVSPMFGDGNVHAILGGATGAGKSAAINQILASLITMYPPSELQMVYVDFKNVEAAKFTRGFDAISKRWHTPDEDTELLREGKYYDRVSRIPHLQIISGTTDGEYALSIFEYLMAEMQRRQKVINTFGKTKLSEVRNTILLNYCKEKGKVKTKEVKKPDGEVEIVEKPLLSWQEMRADWDWYKPNVLDKYGEFPRLLIILDEFQVMFNPEYVDSRTVDTINAKITAITKLARAMGCHFWFTSQSMKGTMSKDTMANFSLRMALRCTPEVSDELIGNKAAGTIKAKFGFMYSNDSAGNDKNANRLWRVPFLDEKFLSAYIDPLYPMLEERHEQHNMAEFYDEKVLIPSTVLDRKCDMYEAFKDSRVFVLGERANFSTNKAPVNFTLYDDVGENIVIAAFNQGDMLNLVNTLVHDIKVSEDSTLIMNCQDQATYDMLAVNELVEEKFLSLSSPKQDINELVDTLLSLIDKREESGETEFKPVYVVLVNWERCEDLGNYKFSDKFNYMLRRGPGVGIHFILACREKGNMSRAIVNNCNHHIVGLMPKDGLTFCNTNKVEKLPDEAKDAGLFALYEFGTTLIKFRIYQFTYNVQIKAREVVI